MNREEEFHYRPSGGAVGALATLLTGAALIVASVSGEPEAVTLLRENHRVSSIEISPGNVAYLHLLKDSRIVETQTFSTARGVVIGYKVVSPNEPIYQGLAAKFK